MNTKSKFRNYFENSKYQPHNEMYDSMNVTEVKKRLFELYNNKISELEKLKNSMEDTRKNINMQVDSIVRQREDENNLKMEKAKQQMEVDNEKQMVFERIRLDESYSKKMQDLEQKYTELEKSFEDRVWETANKIIQNYCRELTASLEVIKEVLEGLENNVSSVIRCHEQLSDEKTTFSDHLRTEVVSGDRDCAREFKYHEDSKILQMEEFRELLEEQDKRVEGIKSVVNAIK